MSTTSELTSATTASTFTVDTAAISAATSSGTCGRLRDETSSSSAPSVIDSIPHWLQPGVSPQIHILVQVVLLSLNAFLGYCGVTGVFRPHFEVMFVLSLGLTGCYYLFVYETAKIHAQEVAQKLERKKNRRKKKNSSSTTTTTTSTSTPSTANKKTE